MKNGETDSESVLDNDDDDLYAFHAYLRQPLHLFHTRPTGQSHLSRFANFLGTSGPFRCLTYLTHTPALPSIL
jgi:hypothetical protein